MNDHCSEIRGPDCHLHQRGLKGKNRNWDLSSGKNRIWVITNKAMGMGLGFGHKIG